MDPSNSSNLEQLALKGLSHKFEVGDDVPLRPVWHFNQWSVTGAESVVALPGLFQHKTKVPEAHTEVFVEKPLPTFPCRLYANGIIMCFIKGRSHEPLKRRQKK